MIRISCPFCLATVGSDGIEAGTYGGRFSLLCPECNHVLVQEEDYDGTASAEHLEESIAV